MGRTLNRTAQASQAVAFSAERGYVFRDRVVNLPVSGLLFRSSRNVVLHAVVDALSTDTPFVFARASARGRRLHGLKLIMLPLSRPVPNMVLLSTTGNVLRKLGIALAESQRLRVEGDFQSRFTLYCPARYEADALYVFTPDLMGRLMDAAPGCDVEVVDNRVLIYAPAHAFSRPGQLDKLPDLVRFLHEKFDRQTQRYRDSRQSDDALKDPFRRAQVTATHGAEAEHLVDSAGRRLRTRTTAWQKVGIATAGAVALAAAAYWVGMVVTALLPG